LTIASLVTAVAYLLLLLVGAVGALLVLVWLFGETQTGTRAESETVKSLRNTKFGEENAPSTRAEIKLPEDRAA
jgi:hypothetical protein